jgi:hypothetical protein
LKQSDPFKLLSTSDDLLRSILELLSCIFFFLPIFDYPIATLETLSLPSTEREISDNLYEAIGLDVAPFGYFLNSILTLLSNLFSYFYFAEVTETLSLI